MRRKRQDLAEGILNGQMVERQLVINRVVMDENIRDGLKDELTFEALFRQSSRQLFDKTVLGAIGIINIDRLARKKRFDAHKIHREKIERIDEAAFIAILEQFLIEFEP